MWWKIRELWLGASIRTKIKIYALAVILVMGLSAGISVQITGFGLDSFNQILYDNSKCNNFHEALTEETDCFTRYARERSQDNREAYEKACEKTAQCLNQLPFDYASIGSERYAGTWTIKSSYMNYQKARDAFLRMDQDTSGYIPALYKVYERQQYMDTYIRRLIQVTLSDGNANYQNEVEKLYNLPRYLVVFSVVLMIFIGMFTRVLSNTLVEPMVKLAGLSREMEKNHFDMPDLAVENRDEMGELVTAFNRMKHSMGDYISTLKRNHEMTELLHKEELERVEMEKQLEAARLEFLKSQINPHFLFNTLNMISCTAKLEKAGTTEKMIASLSSLFRYNLKMSEQVVFLEQELKIVDDYIYIQKMRFGGRIRYERDLPEDIRDIQIPSFTLQPLVENAVVHGISKKETGGRIHLRVWRQDGDVRITVADTGAGMTEEQLTDIRNAVKERRTSKIGIGLGNIYKRVHILYEHGDVQIYSKKDRGTVILIKIPQKLQKS